MFFGLGLMTQPASADLQLIRYDSYADDGEMIYGGYFSDAATGFGKNNCMGMVYSFDKEQYPLELKGLNIFWAGEGAGVTQEAMMRMYIDWYEGEADEFIMRNGAMYRRLENKKILVAGIDLEGTWQELDFETESIRVDFDPDVPGIQPITYGSVVVSMCYVNEQMLPEIAMDVDGFAEEPPPEDGDDYLDGHETSRFRSLIYWNGLWTTSDEYLQNTYGFADGGDFIMRLIIDAQVSETMTRRGARTRRTGTSTPSRRIEWSMARVWMSSSRETGTSRLTPMYTWASTSSSASTSTPIAALKGGLTPT